MSNLNAKAGSASRGTLSPRQLQDIRKLAPVAKSEGVTLWMHGVKIEPLVAPEPCAPVKSSRLTPQRDECNSHNVRAAQLPETGKTSSDAHLSKQQQRSNIRRLELVTKKIAAKWLRMVKKSLQMAAHCRGWEVKRGFLAASLLIRQRSLDFMKRVTSHYTQEHALPFQERHPPPADYDRWLVSLKRGEGHLSVTSPRRSRLSPSTPAFSPVMHDIAADLIEGVIEEAVIGELCSFFECDVAVEEDLGWPSRSSCTTGDQTLPGARDAPSPARKIKTRAGRSKRH